MCPNDNPMCEQPFLPNRWDSLFDSEAGSDVTFLVGPEPETWRFPGHRTILADANPVFRAMFQGPMADSGPIVAIHDIDGRAFDLLLRYLYREDVHLQSVSTALATLYAAHKYLCAGLVKTCTSYLNSNLNSTNVLQIYQHLRLYCNHDGKNKDSKNESRDLGLWIASAPPMPGHEELNTYAVGVDRDPNDNLETMSLLCSSLLHNCLQFIDSHANQVLIEEFVEDLTLDALKEIAQRDSLGITSETILFSVLERWSNRECKRCQLELSAENRRSVLSEDLMFSVRYLLMNSTEFVSGPMQSGLLNSNETTVLMALIINSPISTTTPSLTDTIIGNIKKPRITKNSLLLHNVSKDKPSSSSSSSTNKVFCKKLQDKKLSKSKKQEKQQRKDKSSEDDNKCSQSCFLDYMLGALACLFD